MSKWTGYCVAIPVSKPEAMTEDEIQGTISRHRSRNAELRQVLTANGVSLTQERPVDVHFWSWDQSDAAALARELYRRGYLVTLIARASAESRDEERWNVEAGAKIAPQKVLRDEFTEDLVRLASAHDSAYDGWGTAI
ncbi:MAG: ribonuclease E inhibitor RraB [Bryobacteraceae bacterium]|nr:ribonuclease E inhibitor RraB [Bryobacteraceae bacterium]